MLRDPTIRRKTIPQKIGRIEVSVRVNCSTPVDVREHIGCKERNAVYLLIKSIREKGFPSMKGFDIFYYYLCSKGPHPAVHFIWKVTQSTDNKDEQNAKIVSELQKIKNNT